MRNKNFPRSKKKKKEGIQKDINTGKKLRSLKGKKEHQRRNK